MACFRPLQGYRSPRGQISLDRRSGLPVSVACGQCIGCRVDRVKSWTARIVHEAQMHEKNSFVTLTYDNEHLPKDGSLNVADWQKFAKRLRKAIGPFRFFHCGEYGDKNLRPHYHAIIFGEDFSGDRVLFKETGQNVLFRSALLESTWQNGFTLIGSVTADSAAYVARYSIKKVVGLSASFGLDDRYFRFDSDTGECWSVRPEYVTMSRRPGVGSSWFDRYSSDIFPSDEVVIKGRKSLPPRFYLSKLSEGVREKVMLERRVRSARSSDDRTPPKLLIREQLAEARFRLKKEGDLE